MSQSSPKRWSEIFHCNSGIIRKRPVVFPSSGRSHLLGGDPGKMSFSFGEDQMDELTSLFDIEAPEDEVFSADVSVSDVPAADGSGEADLMNLMMDSSTNFFDQGSSSSAVADPTLSALLPQDTSTHAETSALGMDDLLGISFERNHPIATAGPALLTTSSSGTALDLDLSMLCDSSAAHSASSSLVGTPTSNAGGGAWNGHLATNGGLLNGGDLTSVVTHPASLLTSPVASTPPPTAKPSPAVMGGGGGGHVTVQWPTNGADATMKPGHITTSQVTLQQLSRSGLLSGDAKVKLGLTNGTVGQITVMYPSNGQNALPHPASTGTHVSKTFTLTAQGRAATLAAAAAAGVQVAPSAADDDSDDDEEYAEASTYAEYMPKKLRLGKPHPDSIVESSSLSGVIPPDVWYNIQLPNTVVDEGRLSALQLEAVAYASQQHWTMLQDECRSGFLIGDGAGVGKGRTIAGIIYENYLQGRKRAIWLSVSSDLRIDAERDLSDIGANIRVHSLTKLKYAKGSSSVAALPRDLRKGVMFGTYSALIGETMGQAVPQRRLDRLVEWCLGEGTDFDGVMVFDECHKAKNLLPRNSSRPSKTGQCVLEIQKRLPNARVVYCSATGASEPRHMAYMTRLGIWGRGTQFCAFTDFLSAVEKRGVGGMEVVAMDMKLRGMYVARQLSFHGSTFQVVDVPLNAAFKKMYDDSVALWVLGRKNFHSVAQFTHMTSNQTKTMWAQFWSAHQRFFKYLCIAAKVGHVVNIAKEALANNKCVVIGLQSTGEARTLEQLDGKNSLDLEDFISTAKGVLQSLIEKHFPGGDRDKGDDLTFSKGRGQKRKTNGDSYATNEDSATSVDTQTEESDESDGGGSDGDDDEWGGSSSSYRRKPKRKKTNTMEDLLQKQQSNNAALAALGGSSTMKWQVSSLLQEQENAKNARSRPSKPSSLPNSTPSTPSRTSRPVTTDGNGKNDQLRALEMRQELEDCLEELGPRLPVNTLDELIQHLGGSSIVAEMTGRRGRVIGMEDGTIVYEPRAEASVSLDQINIMEKDRFMRGEKLIAIISEAASSGISMQADRRVKNQRRRVHITLELPWSADRAIQQFGRTHRSNQTSAPEYLFLISELSGERRFASVVAKRLESLGALTHGDRRATESRDLSRYNYDTKYGRTSLEYVLRSVMTRTKQLIPIPSASFFDDVSTGLVGVGLLQETRQALCDSKDLANLPRFLNRILGFPVDLQNLLFAYFADMLAAVVAAAKRNGRYDEGILDVDYKEAEVKLVESEMFEGSTSVGTTFTEMHTVKVERGMTWDKACELLESCNNASEGFYLSKKSTRGKQRVVLVLFRDPDGASDKCNLYQPNLGLLPRQDKLSMLLDKYFQAADMSIVQKCWTERYAQSAEGCAHAFLSGRCRRKLGGEECEVGRRQRTYHILSGSVLSVWNEMERILQRYGPASQQKIQIMRVKTGDGRVIIGNYIPANCVTHLRQSLRRISDEQTNKDSLS